MKTRTVSEKQLRSIQMDEGKITLRTELYTLIIGIITSRLNMPFPKMNSQDR